MKYIECSCGEDFGLDYNYVQKVTHDLVDYYRWICKHCGAIVEEPQPTPLSLKGDVVNGTLSLTKVDISKL